MDDWPWWLCGLLILLAVTFVTRVCHALATRWAYMIQRHELVIEARRRRIVYEREQHSLAEDEPDQSTNV